MQSSSPRSSRGSSETITFNGAIYCPFCTKRVVIRDYEAFIEHLMALHRFTERGAEIEVGRQVLRYVGNQGNTMLSSRWMRPELERLYIEEDRTLEEIGKMFGVSRQRVHQVVSACGLRICKNRQH